MTTRHFLDLADHSAATLAGLIESAKKLKSERGSSAHTGLLAGKTLAMIFEKHSTRTRVSFEVGMKELGGQAIFLSRDEMQLGRGETVADTARVLSRFIHVIVARTRSHGMIEELARHGSVPVINGLTDWSHPCQIMADILTFEEHRGPIRGKTIAWCGDGNNVLVSWIHAAARFGFTLRIACPSAYRPPTRLLDWAEKEKADVTLCKTPQQAVEGADAVVTDTWVSMGDTDARQRMETFQPYQVTPELMALAAKEAIFLHCLPAHRGEEVTAAVIDGPQSVIFDEAENRLHAQKAILAWCLGEEPRI